MKLKQLFALGAAVAALCMSGGNLLAQDNPDASGDAQGRRNRGGGGGGNFDPAQFQQRMMENVRDRLGFTNDTDWNAVQPLVQKVMDARRDVGFGGGGGFGRGGRRGGGGPGGDNQNGDQGARRNFFGQPSPEAEALQKVIDDNSPKAQIKAALEKYQASQKAKHEKLVAAQENLRKVLNTKQEAQATLLGLLE